MRKYPAAPHPFVLRASLNQPTVIDTGQTFTIDVALIGRAIGHLPYVTEAFRVAGRNGLGRQRGRFKVVELDQWMGEGTWQSLGDGGCVQSY